jgi:hypothetical protein
MVPVFHLKQGRAMYIVKSVGVLSFGKILGGIYGVLGLLFMPIFLLAGIMSTLTGGKGAAFGAAGALVMAVVFPILYGLLGFVAGAIGALLYNLFAKWLGGIELQLQPAAAVSLPA